MLGSVARRPVARAAQVLDDLIDRLAFRERLREHAVWNVWAEVVGVTEMLSPLTRTSRGSSITTSSSTCCGRFSSIFTTGTRLKSRMDVIICNSFSPHPE